MSIVNDTSFIFKKQFKFNFNGDELSSDGGLFLLKEFAHRIGFEKSFISVCQDRSNTFYATFFDDR